MPPAPANSSATFSTGDPEASTPRRGAAVNGSSHCFRLARLSWRRARVMFARTVSAVPLSRSRPVVRISRGRGADRRVVRSCLRVAGRIHRAQPTTRSRSTRSARLSEESAKIVPRWMPRIPPVWAATRRPPSPPGSRTSASCAARYSIGPAAPGTLRSNALQRGLRSSSAAACREPLTLSERRTRVLGRTSTTNSRSRSASPSRNQVLHP